jgi:hypothetical protein
VRRTDQARRTRARRDVAESAAADGQLLAHEVAASRSKTTFTRVHARALGDRVTHEAEKLHDAAASRDTAGPKRDAVELAQAIGDDLAKLQLAPQDGALARRIEDRLGGATRRADALADAL